MPRGWPDYTYPVSLVINEVAEFGVRIDEVAGGVTFDANIVGSTTTLDVKITESTVTLNADVNITGSTVTLDVNVTNTSIAVQATIVDSTVTLDVNITNSIINVAASQVGTWSVDANITNAVLNVEISGTPTVNIQTQDGVSIVIDKLTTRAFYEVRQVYSNTGSAVSGWQTLDKPYGKLFSRQCRGWIVEIGVYLRNPKASPDTLIVKLSPFPNMAVVKTVTETIPANEPEGTVWVKIYDYWVYDSLFISVESANGFIEVGYDNDAEPAPDSWYYDSASETWLPEPTGIAHFWIEARIYGQTVGSVPVDGVVGTYEFPSISSRAEASLAPYSEGSYTLIEVDSPGHLSWLTLSADSPELIITIYCDGYVIWQSNLQFIHDWINEGNVATGITITKWDTANSNYAVCFHLPLSWRKKFEVEIEVPTGMTITAGAFCIYRSTA